MIEDLGSKLNYNKRGLRNLIRSICLNEIDRLVLTHKDRLLRFGSELIFSFWWIKRQHVPLKHALKSILLQIRLCTAAREIFAHIQHRLFADIASGKNPGELKNDYLACYQITARHFNALRVQVEGKIASIKKRRPGLILEEKERIASLTTKIKKLTKRKADPQIIHQKKRWLNRLTHKLQQLQEEHKKGTIRCCFGSKKLFHAQFDLEANGYPTHQEWLKDWRKARARELFFLGSKDETAGNQTCTATIQPNDTLQLRIRLPDALKKDKYLILSDVHFTYGKQELLYLLKNSQRAISWRLQHDRKGWRLFATFDIQPAPLTSKSHIGVIGLDINVDHFALVETDRNGNPISKKTIPFNLYGKSSDQTRGNHRRCHSLCHRTRPRKK